MAGTPLTRKLVLLKQQLAYSHPIREEQFFFKVLDSDDH